MTPDQLTAITTIAGIAEKIGSGSIFTLLLFVVVAPWIAAFWLDRLSTRRAEADRKESEKRFEQVVKMYESNARLVTTVTSLAEDAHQLVIASTTAITQNTDAIKSNDYCPVIRERKQFEARGI